MSKGRREQIASRIEAALVLVDGNIRHSGEAMALLQIAAQEIEQWFEEKNGKESYGQWQEKVLGAELKSVLTANLGLQEVEPETVTQVARQLQQLASHIPWSKKPVSPRKLGLIVGALIGILLVVTLSYWLGGKDKVWTGRFYPGRVPGKGGSGFVSYFSHIDFDWTGRKPHDQIRKDPFSGVLTSCLVLENPAKVTFVIGSDDGFRLRVNNQLVSGIWQEQAFTQDVAELELSAGIHMVEIEYFNAGGTAELRGHIDVAGLGLREMDEHFFRAALVDKTGAQCPK